MANVSNVTGKTWDQMDELERLAHSIARNNNYAAERQGSDQWDDAQALLDSLGFGDQNAQQAVQQEAVDRIASGNGQQTLDNALTSAGFDRYSDYGASQNQQLQSDVLGQNNAFTPDDLVFSDLYSRTDGDAQNFGAAVSNMGYRSQATMDDAREAYDDSRQLQQTFGDFDTYIDFLIEREGLGNADYIAQQTAAVRNDTLNSPVYDKLSAGRPVDESELFSNEVPSERDAYGNLSLAYDAYAQDPEVVSLMERYGIQPVVYNNDGDKYEWTGSGYVKTGKVDDHMDVGDVIKAGAVAGLGIAGGSALGPIVGNLLGGTAGNVAAGMAGSAISQAITTGQIDPTQLVVSGATAGIGDALSGLESVQALSTDIDIVDSVLAAGGTSAVSQLVTTGEVDPEAVAIAMAFRGASDLGGDLLSGDLFNNNEFDFASGENWDVGDDLGLTADDLEVITPTGTVMSTQLPPELDPTPAAVTELTSESVNDLITSGRTPAELAAAFDMTPEEVLAIAGSEYVDVEQGEWVPEGMEFATDEELEALLANPVLEQKNYIAADGTRYGREDIKIDRDTGEYVHEVTGEVVQLDPDYGEMETIEYSDNQIFGEPVESGTGNQIFEVNSNTPTDQGTSQYSGTTAEIGSQGAIYQDIYYDPETNTVTTTGEVKPEAIVEFVENLDLPEIPEVTVSSDTSSPSGGGTPSADSTSNNTTGGSDSSAGVGSTSQSAADITIEIPAVGAGEPPKIISYPNLNNFIDQFIKNANIPDAETPSVVADEDGEIELPTGGAAAPETEEVQDEQTEEVVEEGVDQSEGGGDSSETVAETDPATDQSENNGEDVDADSGGDSEAETEGEGESSEGEGQTDGEVTDVETEGDGENTDGSGGDDGEGDDVEGEDDATGDSENGDDDAGDDGDDDGEGDDGEDGDGEDGTGDGEGGDGAGGSGSGGGSLAARATTSGTTTPNAADIDKYEIGGPLDNLMRELGLESGRASRSSAGEGASVAAELDSYIDAIIASQDRGESGDDSMESIMKLIGIA